jgi:hypothetical protein
MLRTVNSIHPASTLAFRPTPEASLPRTLASPRTGLTPASDRDLVARLRHVDSFVFTTPKLLDARPDLFTELYVDPTNVWLNLSTSPIAIDEVDGRWSTGSVIPLSAALTNNSATPPSPNAVARDHADSCVVVGGTTNSLNPTLGFVATTSGLSNLARAH